MEKKFLIQKNSLLNNSKSYDTYSDIIKPIFDSFDLQNNNLTFEDRMILLELKYRLPELLLMRADKMTMSTSVEARVPYLDHHIVQYSLDIPQTLRLKSGSKKYILKEAARGILPDRIIDKKKWGFCGSASNMLSNPVVDYAEDIIIESEWMNKIFNIDCILPLFSDHKSKKKDNGMKIFTLLNLALWQKYWSVE